MFSVKFPLSWEVTRGHFSALSHSLQHTLGKSPGTRNTFKISHFYQDKIIIFQTFPPPCRHSGEFTRGEPIKLVTQILHCGKAWIFLCHGSIHGFSEYSLLFADTKSRKGWSVLSIHVKVQEGKVEISSSPSSPGTFVLSSLEARIKDLQRKGYQRCSFTSFFTK